MSQIPLRSVRLNARPATTLESFVGTAGEIFYDSTNQTLRVYPGNIAAGKILADRDWVNSAIGDIGTSSLVNGTRTVSLSTAGSLTIPGDIRSESNINIEINLADSTLQRWSFGEDGSLTFPDGTTQTTAWLGAGPVFTSLIDSLDSSAITITPSAIFSSDVTVENDLVAKNIVNNGQFWQFGTDGNLTVPGDIVFPNNGSYIEDSESFFVATNGDFQIQTNKTLGQQDWTFGANGTLTAPGAIDAPSIFTNLIDSADSSAITITPAVIFSSDVTVENELKIKTLVNDQSKWRFGADGIITLPNSMTIDGSGTGGESVLIGGTSTQIIVSNDGAPPGFYVRTNFNVDPKIWLFGPDGSTTFPAGGTITEGGGISGAIRLTPAGGANEYQALLIYPTAGEGDHIHLTAGGGSTELYLGNDLHYVKLANDGFVIIQADNGVNGAVWGFAPDGTTSIPGDIKSDSNINIEINLSDSTKRIWQFGEDGQLTFPDGGNLRVSAVPATSIGAAGDTAGMLAFNASYAYYCTANYDGVTNIWRRTAHDVATW